MLVSRSIYIIAGEVSGDTHGACLMDELLKMDSDMVFSGAGGPEMKRVGGEGIDNWIEDAAVMGIVEVLRHYRWFKQRFQNMLEQAVAMQPDTLVLVDYPGFNLRFARAIRERIPGIKIIYYISPQVWAWNKGRIPKMAEMLDLMLCIFPFEQPIFESTGLKTVFTGHPLVDELEEKREDVECEHHLIGLFPGSRKREVFRLFPVMVETVRRIHSHLPDVRFEASAASEALAVTMQSMIDDAQLPESIVITVVTGRSHSLMQRATCGVVASGTATLEAAMFGLPYCLVYKVAWPTYALGRMLVKVDAIGLVNILAGEKIVEEFIQADADPGHIEASLVRLMGDDTQRAELSQKLLETASRLGEPGVHQRAATEILKIL